MKNLPAVATAWARALAGRQDARRRALFRLTVTACVAVFAGGTFLEGFLGRHTAVFVVYWLAVAWLTLTIVLLALYDVLDVIATGRRERRELERRLREEQNFSTKSRRSPTSPDP